jgi:hypothetical protein
MQQEHRHVVQRRLDCSADPAGHAGTHDLCDRARNRDQTAATVELTLFRRLLALGAALLRLFFLTRAAARPSAPSAVDGRVLDYHDQRMTTYVSVFGKLHFSRHYFIAAGQAGCFPWMPS